MKEEIHFEFSETDKIMKRMEEIMKGGADGVGEAAHDGFEQSGLQKGTSALLDANQNAKQMHDQD